MVSGTSLLKTINLVVINTCIYVHLAFPLQWLSSFKSFLVLLVFEEVMLQPIENFIAKPLDQIINSTLLYQAWFIKNKVHYNPRLLNLTCRLLVRIFLEHLFSVVLQADTQSKKSHCASLSQVGCSRKSSICFVANIESISRATTLLSLATPKLPGCMSQWCSCPKGVSVNSFERSSKSRAAFNRFFQGIGLLNGVNENPSNVSTFSTA